MGEFRFDDELVGPALTAAGARFAGVEERFSSRYRLRLPRHMSVFAAFFEAIGPIGRSALSECAGLSTGGISRYFEAEGPALAGRDGLDERLESRFRCDPPELVTIMRGDTDGLHFGLWYDDPAELPSFVAYNYARDSAETWTANRLTGLAQIAKRLDDVEQDIADDPGYEYPGQADIPELRAALEAFADADLHACEVDGTPRWTQAERPVILGGLGPALPDGAGDPRGGFSAVDARYQGYRARSPEVLEWIAQAEAELRSGKPAYAFTLGRELHWLDTDPYRETSLRLLTSAYTALGREALADIARVHHAHRDLRSVSVLN